MKTAKKLVVLMVVLAMVFALSTTAFADTSGTVTVTFLVPKSYTLPGQTTPTVFPQPDDYTANGSFSDYYEYTISGLDLSDVSSFTNGNDLNVFDVIYEVAVNQKEESEAELNDATNSTEFVYHYDANPAYGNPGWVIDRLSGLETDEVQATNNSWAGFYWSVYGVPSGITYNVTNPTYVPETHSFLYQLGGYTSNVEAESGYTYYMVYVYEAMSW